MRAGLAVMAVALMLGTCPACWPASHLLGFSHSLLPLIICGSSNVPTNALPRLLWQATKIIYAVSWVHLAPGVASDPAALRAAYDAGKQRLRHLDELLSPEQLPSLSHGRIEMSLSQRPNPPGAPLLVALLLRGAPTSSNQTGFLVAVKGMEVMGPCGCRCLFARLSACSPFAPLGRRTTCKAASGGLLIALMFVCRHSAAVTPFVCVCLWGGGGGAQGNGS